MMVLAGSLILSLTLTPTLAYYLLPRKLEEREAWLVRWSKWAYAPILSAAIRLRIVTVSLGIAALAGAAWIAMSFGTEFVPQLSEGAIVVGVLRVPGTSLEQSAEMNLVMEKHLRNAYPTRLHMSGVGSASQKSIPTREARNRQNVSRLASPRTLEESSHPS